MGYLAKDSLNPRTFVFSCNADALVIQSTQTETKIAFINSYGSNDLEPIFYLSASNEVFKIIKNASDVVSFGSNQTGYLSVQGSVISNKVEFTGDSTRQIVFKDYGTNDQFAGIGYQGGKLTFQVPTTAASYQFQTAQGANTLPLVSLQYNNTLQEPRLGIGITNPQEALNVIGNILASGTIITSNLRVLGETVILDTITSNTEQLRITNSGLGPALYVDQDFYPNVSEFYHNSNLIMIVANTGVGIGTTTPRYPLDVIGDSIISGNLGIGTLTPQRRLDIYGDVQISGAFYKNGKIFRDVYTEWEFDYISSNLYHRSGNVAIGTSNAIELLTVDGNILYHGLLKSTITNQAPFIINSTYLVQNLNAQYLDGKDSAYYTNVANITEGIIPVSQGGTGSNYLSFGKLLVGQGSNKAIISPHDLHWENTNKQLGIGTIIPFEKLHIIGNLMAYSDQTTKVRVGTSLTSNLSAQVGYYLYTPETVSELSLYSQENTTLLRLWNSNNHAMIFGTNNQERLRLTETGNVGIGTKLPQSPFHIVGTSILQGNVGIGTNITPVTLTILASDAVLLPSGSNAQRPSGRAGYIRYNTESGQFEGFGAGNQWGSLGGVKSVSGDTYILAEYSPGNNDQSLHFYTAGIENVTIDKNGNVGIGSTNPQVSFVVSSTNAVQLPKGSVVQRPVGTKGYIRYNTDNDQFEGFGAGNQWGSLGGVKSVSGDTYILSEYTPGNNDQSLHFFTSNIEHMILDRHGNLGIGTTVARSKLDVQNGSSIFVPNVGIGTSLPRDTFDVVGTYLHTGSVGINTLLPRSTLDVIGHQIITGNIGIGTITPITPLHVVGVSYIDGKLGVGTVQPRQVFDVEGHSIISGNLGVGTNSPRQKIDVEGSMIVTNNMGIGTIKPLSLLHLYRTGGTTNVSALRIENDAETGGQDPAQYLQFKERNGDTFGIAPLFNASGDNNKLLITASSSDVAPRISDAKITLLQEGYVGIGTSVPRQLLDVMGSIITQNGSLGIGTTTMVERFELHGGNGIVMGNVGIGTFYARRRLDVVGDEIITGNLGIATDIPLSTLDTNGDLYVRGNTRLGTTFTDSGSNQVSILGRTTVTYNGSSPAVSIHQISGTGNILQLSYNNQTKVVVSADIGKQGFVGIGTTVPRKELDVDNSTGTAMIIASGNIGIGTTQPIFSLHTEGKSYLKDSVGIGTSIPRQFVDIQGGSLIVPQGSIGVGTTIPQYKMHVQDGHLFVYNGNVGIGTGFTPQRPLHIMSALDNTFNAVIRLATANTASGDTGIEMFEDTTTNLGTKMVYHTGDNKFYIQTLNSGTTFYPFTAVRINGNVGIGSTSPVVKLDIAGQTQVQGKLHVTSDLNVLGNIGIGTAIPLDRIHILGNTYLQGNLGIGTTFARGAIDIDTGKGIFGNIGVGTTLPRQSVDVIGSVVSTQVGINTYIPTKDLDVRGDSIFSGNVGIQTVNPRYPLHIQGGENVVSVSGDGKLAIAKGSVAILPTTDLDIVSSSSASDYTGVLLRNNGNLYPTASIRVQSTRWDASTNSAFAGTLGLSRYNNNTYQRANAPLGAIHFGGNHTNNSLTNVQYNASIEGIAETDFTSSSTASTAIVFKTGSNAYSYIDTGDTQKGFEVLRVTGDGKVGIKSSVPSSTLDVGGNVYIQKVLQVNGERSFFMGNVGIGTTSPRVTLEAIGTDAIRIPVGSNSHRPTGIPGYIRYNTQNQQFEGFGPGNQWGSLGGVKSVNGDTYILAEYTPGNDDKSLHFYTNGVEQMILNPYGNLGIGYLDPDKKLFVNGDIYTNGKLFASNLEIMGDSVIINAITSNSEQVVIYNRGTGPALKVYQTGDQPIAEFYDGDYPDSQVSVKIANNGYVGINTHTPRERFDVVGNSIVSGNLGIGTTIPMYGVHITKDVAIGSGMYGTYDSYQGGPYYRQKTWDMSGTNHLIPFPEYCVTDNSSGTIHIQVKSAINHKMGNVSLSFLKGYGQNVEIFSIYYHKSDSITTMQVEVQGVDIKVTTDSDCRVAWSSIGAC